MNAIPKKTESKSRNAAAELSDAELEKATGGGIIDTVVNAYLKAVGKNLNDAIHPPTPTKNLTLHMR